MSLSWDKGRELLRRNAALLAVLAAGLGLMLWPQRVQVPEQTAAELTEEEAYVLALESRLAEALSQIAGAGRVRVVLTWEQGSRRELAADVKGEEHETVVVSGGTGRQETVVVQASAPRLRGALVVCPGGGEPQVRLNLLRSVMALTGLQANQISICQGGRTE